LNSPQLTELRESLQSLPAEVLLELDELLKAEKWLPLPGPQTEAFNSQADVLFYGGAAGGGKTDLVVGLALTQHVRSIVFRRESKQLLAVIDRMAEILGHREGLNAHEGVWRMPPRQVEFGSCKDPGDEQAHQGRPHDLLAFDEITHFQEQQFRFLQGWARTTNPRQRVRIVCTGNPPTDSNGQWVIRYWAPWLDPKHPRPAKSGELRWYWVRDGVDTEVETGEGFRHNGKWIKPKSRTFIPSRVTDNVFLMETDYEATLQALPEPLRSQMLEGDFMAGVGDGRWQLYPTGWVTEAQARWQPTDRPGVMDSVGVDVARGGRDKTIISRRHGHWYAPLIALPGAESPDGPTVAGAVLANARNGAPIHVDVIGVGSSVFDFLRQSGVTVTGVNGSEKSEGSDRSGRLRFVNRRAELHWKFRELLDPANGEGIALPPDPELRSDLCGIEWKLTQRGIQVESKEEIFERIGRSPDRSDAVLLASITTPKGWNRALPTRRAPA
jgi:Terminase large subunit, T4likevirus-type, N-terminal